MNVKKLYILCMFSLIFFNVTACSKNILFSNRLDGNFYISSSASLKDLYSTTLASPIILASNSSYDSSYDFSSDETSASIVNDDTEDDFWFSDDWEYERPVLYEPDPDDPDRDGLLNEDEEYYNTDPNDPDTDNDGFMDGWEIDNGFDPNSYNNIGYLEVQDIVVDDSSDDIDDSLDSELSDETELIDIVEYEELAPDNLSTADDTISPLDSVSNNLESVVSMDAELDGEVELLESTGTSIDMTPIYMLLLLNDNDNDGIDDDWEVRHFGSIDDCDPDEDTDADNLTNLEEFKNNTNPNNPDSDSDGLTDGFEVLNGMNPTSTDSDEDLMPDNYEVTNGLNPILNDARSNLDNDGFTNYQEYILTTDPNDNTDTPSAPDDVDLGFDYDEQQGGGGLVGETIRISNGNIIEYRSDLSFSSPNQLGLSLEAFYNSQSNYSGSMGYGWSHTYEVFLDDDYSLGTLTLLKITDSTGHAHYFYEEATGVFTGVFAEKTTVLEESTGYTWYLLDGTKYGFSATGQLLWIDDSVGNRLSLTYNTSNKLETVTDNASGRVLTFNYDGNGYFDNIQGPVTVAVPSGSSWVDYTVTDQNLTSVTYADNTGFDYTYADTNDSHNLTQKENKAGHKINTWTYNAFDQATANYSRDGKGVDLIVYQSSTQVDVTDAYNKTRSYYLTTSSTRNRLESITEAGGRPGAIPWNSSNAVFWIYDNSMNPVEIEYAGGAVNLYENYDAKGNPGKVYFGWDATEETALRTIEYTYHPELNTPLIRTEPSVIGSGNKETIWDYDDPDDLEDDESIYNENPTNLPYKVIEKGYTKDSTGTIITYTYTTKVTYDSKGQVLSINGPRDEVGGVDDLIAVSYDTTTGDILSVTRPHIGSTGYSGHDLAGQVGTVTDVNNQSRSYIYDGRGRVTDVTNNADSSVSSIVYNNAGEVSSRIDEDNVATTYFYNDPLTDTGHLYRIVDSENNYIEYSYDNEGNVTEKSYNESDGTPTKITSYLYQDSSHNMPGLLYKEINADNTFTQYSYFPSGDVQAIQDPEGNLTEYTYDDLNRIRTVTQHDGTINIITTYDYDAHGNLESVEDAEGHITYYNYDDMGRLVSTTSPDTGTVTYVYDEAGNPVSKTDQKDITVTYEYDFLNRLTTANFPEYVIDETETLDAYSITYSYDSGTNGIGHRTGMSDQSGAASFSYDNRGRLAEKTTTVNSLNYTLSRTFTDAGRIDTVTYPSGRTVDFQRKGACPCKVTDIYTSYNTATNMPLFTSLDYRPFGGARSLSTGGNGTVGSTFSTTGRMTVSNPGAAHERVFTYDNLGNITGITGTTYTFYNRTYDYDELYRLENATGPWGSIGYTYDKVGNRITKTIDSVTDTYAYVSDTNIIDSITTSTGTIDYSNDENGSITAIDDKALVYNQNNRMMRAEDTSTSTILGEYVYNGLGQRITKSTDEGTTVFQYDFDGNIIAESDASGNLSKEYIYKGSNRIALVDYSSETNGEIYFFGNDTLGTPIMLTDSDNNIIWEATYKPFGEAEVNPRSLVVNNFRFKGQYYDSETGFHYNYHRYYEPATRRYLTPDPIGQAGGLNLYSYVENNPVNNCDPKGLMVDGGVITVPTALIVVTAGVIVYTLAPQEVKDQMAKDVKRFWDWATGDEDDDVLPPERWEKYKDWEWAKDNMLDEDQCPKNGDDDDDGECEAEYEADRLICSSLKNPRAQNVCNKSAFQRFSNCLAGRPPGPLVTKP